MEFSVQKKRIILLLGFLQALIIALIIINTAKLSPLNTITITNEQVTSDVELYGKLEEMCKKNDGKNYDECSRSPLCGTEKDGWSEDKKVEAYDNLVGQVGSTQDSPQSCMGDGGGRSKGCGGENVPLCCYAMAATGDPLKCAGYWERLWCPTDLCNKIDSSKDDACGGGKCQCAHAWSEYCKAGGETPGKPSISLCERLKKEGVTGIVCASDAPAVTPTPVVVQYTKPRCSSMNFLDGSNSVITPEQKVNDQQTVNISIIGIDDNAKPSKIDFCWALGGQSKEYYFTATNWGCELTTLMQAGSTPNSLIAELKGKNILYFMQKLPNLTTTQVKDYGLVITTRIYSSSNVNQLCSTNPGYNNGSGVMVDLLKQDPALRFVNSTCGLGTVANVPAKSCSLKLMYNPGSSNVSYDLNGDGKLDISDFTIFVGYYKTKNDFVDFNGDGKVGIEDFSYFRNEYVKVQGGKS
ncbi:dockerin type I repeat-containing protein [Candidatus Dojkabacteria bacterium]|nr:dockerin type I repeat-containing protein [Candidatus Dojkabacteria bacterium]